jgi:hypothetical protein
MSNTQESAFETALEQGLHENGSLGEFEGGETEGILGTIGNVLGGLLSEGEIVSEAGESAGILGAIGNVLGGLLGEEEAGAHEAVHESEFESELESELGGHGESEWEHAFAQESELESELAHEHPEQFFGGIFKKIGGLVRKAAPVLSQVARVAAPMVAKAVGGPFGGILSNLAGSLLGESEEEMELGTHEFAHESVHESLHEFAHETGLHELAHEQSHESGLHEGHPESGLHEIAQEIQHELATEAQHESSNEVAHEIASHEIAHHEALAEVMAEGAAQEYHEGNAEAMVGAAVITTLSPGDRRGLRLLLADLVRGTAVLTRILRRRRITRPAIRAVPTIVRRTVRSLKRQAAQGKPITRRAAAKAAAVQVRRVLGNPRACAAAISQNVRATRALRAKSARTAPVIRG